MKGSEQAADKMIVTATVWEWNERSDCRVVCFREEAVRPGESHLPESLQLVRQPPQGDQETGQHW